MRDSPVPLATGLRAVTTQLPLSMGGFVGEIAACDEQAEDANRVNVRVEVMTLGPTDGCGGVFVVGDKEWSWHVEAVAGGYEWENNPSSIRSCGSKSR